MEHGHNTRDDLQGAHDNHAPHGVGKYVAVFVALCVLTAISFAVGNSQQLRQNSPGVMWAMMMAVSSAKAMLVILFFMHLRWEANWKYVLTVPASIMSVFLALMLVPDIGLRTLHYSATRWLYAAEPGSRHGEEAGHLPADPSMHTNENIDHSKTKKGH
jgi:cytochrome c oxidase subunit IV